MEEKPIAEVTHDHNIGALADANVDIRYALHKHAQTNIIPFYVEKDHHTIPTLLDYFHRTTFSNSTNRAAHRHHAIAQGMPLKIKE